MYFVEVVVLLNDALGLLIEYVSEFFPFLNECV